MPRILVMVGWDCCNVLTVKYGPFVSKYPIVRCREPWGSLVTNHGVPGHKPWGSRRGRVPVVFVSITLPFCHIGEAANLSSQNRELAAQVGELSFFKEGKYC